MATANDDLSKLTGEMYRQWEKSTAQWWDSLLESPAFLDQMGKGVEQNATARKHWEEQVDKTMADLHLPSRKDVVRIAKIASMLEDRLLGLEDRLEGFDDSVKNAEKEALKARIEAAEARVALDDRLTAIEARLEAIAKALETDKPRRATKS